jgi:lysine 6-dehydrogenase
MKKVIVLGAGLVGAPMALDLAKNGEFEVTVADVNQAAFDKLSGAANIKVVAKDLSDAGELKRLISDQDIVLSAIPGFMGFQTLKTIIEAGKDVIDISFFPEDMFELDALAREKGVVAITDIGVAPGMSNVLIGNADAQFDQSTKAVIYVGGLPKKRQWPYEYKAVFSPIDVIEEYTRPARYIENGFEVVRPALSDPELLDFPGIGTLEAFNSDGLRSLAKTIDCPNMIEKTMRYKGHIEIMAILRETGFFDKEPMEIKGVKISPLEFTSKILFPKWKLDENEEDITVMRVIVEGLKDGKKQRITYDLFDSYDPETGIHSMARTTGYTATMALRMLAEGLYSRKGISVPEYIGKDEKCVEFILAGLEQRGVIYNKTVGQVD